MTGATADECLDILCERPSVVGHRRDLSVLGKKGCFRVVGDTLFFNDDVHPAERDVTGKSNSDATELGAYVVERPEITTIDLRSEPG